MDHDFGGASLRLLDPEAAKQGKLLAVGLSDIERQATRGQPINLAAREGAKIAGPLEHDDLIEQVQSVQRTGDAKTGKSQTRLWRQLAGERPQIEIGVVGSEGANVAAVDQVDFDRCLEEPAGGQNLQLELQIFSAPDGALAAKPDLAKLVIIQILGTSHKVRCWRLVGLLCQLAGAALNRLVRKRRRGTLRNDRGPAACQAAEKQGRQLPCLAERCHLTICCI